MTFSTNRSRPSGPAAAAGPRQARTRRAGSSNSQGRSPAAEERGGGTVRTSVLSGIVRASRAEKTLCSTRQEVFPQPPQGPQVAHGRGRLAEPQGGCDVLVGELFEVPHQDDLPVL